MSYTDILQDSLSALQFETDGVQQIQSNVDAVTYGIFTLIIASIAQSIGQLNPFGIVLYPIAAIIGAGIGTGIHHLFAKLFGGQGSYRDLFAVLTNGQLAFWVSVIPIIGPFLAGLIGLYYIAFTVFAIKSVYGLSIPKSIAVLLLPGIIVAVLIAIIAVLFIGSVLSSFAGLAALA